MPAARLQTDLNCCVCIKDARKGDVLLVSSIDSLSRLPVEDWQKLKAAIDSKGGRIVALDLPTSR
jgi:DNA invertase Pin-like site-specific DNA recombinase